MGPSRPRRDDVRRYCLRCSEKTGRLVERISPALQQERERKALKAKERREREAAEREALQRAYFTVRTVNAAGERVDVDCEKEVKRMCRLAAGRKSYLARHPPSLGIQRRSRSVEYGVGHAWHFGRITITVSEGLPWEELQVLLLHEVCHLADTSDDKSHGQTFRKLFARSAGKCWPGLGRLPWKPKWRTQYDLCRERLGERTIRLKEAGS